jgi:branched-chain amino acid transport system permease protein
LVHVGGLLHAGMMFFMWYYNSTDFSSRGFAAGIKAFTAAVLGGISPGAMLGRMLIGLIEVMWSAFPRWNIKKTWQLCHPRAGVDIIHAAGPVGKPEVKV